MATISQRLHHNTQANTANTHHQREFITEEIQGLIRVHRNGHVERPPIVPRVSSTTSSESGVTARDVVINKDTNLWARIYVPLISSSHSKSNHIIPLLVYFHGGGFCVGSAAWKCYHEFLTNLAFKATCVIVSVEYKLAPENPLPAAYDDGLNVLMWVKREAQNVSCSVQKWWLSHCNLSCMFLAGDSAGANIAYNVATRLGTSSPLSLKGVILIQPFFGGEERTFSEKHSLQPPNSALTLSVSDTYWRLALPHGANRDHPYCNPFVPHAKLRDLRIPSIMVCASELDILRDRNLEFSNTLTKAGKRVETMIYKGVGHAFQVLHNYQLSQSRTQEMLSHISNFLNQ
ncbi:hypothetical protein RIF29_13943 [Crotalaria pallida]|uniref:Alpha/beta hydrolase fold-3 domain-containing protein n=1 Tax=Crotalaria pallida TaxID=3830 RepID=A0AAN9FCW1_CROPI